MVGSNWRSELMDDVARVLSRAADLIQSHGWIRGAYGHCGVGLCIEGAIRVARDYFSREPELFIDARNRVIAQLQKEADLWGEEFSRSLTKFNDECCPDKVSAVAVLRRAVIGDAEE